jgi:hypothetical protein
MRPPEPCRERLVFGHVSEILVAFDREVLERLQLADKRRDGAEAAAAEGEDSL